MIGASGLGAGLQAAASGLLSAANNVGAAYIQGQDIDWVDVAADAFIGAGSSLFGSALTKKSVDAANALITKGIDKISIGKARYASGSRYWKGAVKKGFRYLRPGIRKLHSSRGRASVIGSTSGSTISIFKSWLF